MDQGWAALFGAMIGAVAGLGSAWWIERTRAKRVEKSLALALRAEITAILDILQERGYIEFLDYYIQKFKGGERPKFQTPSVKQNYFTVYEQNASSIGSLPSDVSPLVARFYTFAKAFIEDCDGANERTVAYVQTSQLLELFEESKVVLVKAIEAGRTASDKLGYVYLKQ